MVPTPNLQTFSGGAIAARLLRESLRSQYPGYEFRTLCDLHLPSIHREPQTPLTRETQNRGTPLLSPPVLPRLIRILTYSICAACKLGAKIDWVPLDEKCDLLHAI
jgi:hypothetical protein